MLTKDNVLKTISAFPDSFTLDELIDKLIFLNKVEKGIDQSIHNQINTPEEAKKKLSKWLK